MNFKAHASTLSKRTRQKIVQWNDQTKTWLIRVLHQFSVLYLSDDGHASVTKKIATPGPAALRATVQLKGRPIKRLTKDIV
jgi:hypothetical protein